MCATDKVRGRCDAQRVVDGCCGAGSSWGGLGLLSVASSLPSRLMGLLGRERAEGVLMLVPCADVHTVGMRFPVDVAFVDRGGVVLAARRGLAPGGRMRVRGASFVLERQARDSVDWFCPGDQVVLGIGRED